MKKNPISKRVLLSRSWQSSFSLRAIKVPKGQWLFWQISEIFDR